MSSTTAGRDALEGRVWFWWDGRVLLSTLVFKCYQHARVQSVLSFCALGCTRFHNLSHPRPLRAFFLTTPGVTARGWSGVLRRDLQKLHLPRHDALPSGNHCQILAVLFTPKVFLLY